MKELAPVLLKDTELLTPKWDAVVTPISGKQIPIHLQILNSSVALTWSDSSPICLRCHNTSHKNQDCPLRPAPRPRPSRTYAAQNISNTNSHFHQNKSTPNIDPSADHSLDRSQTTENTQLQLSNPDVDMTNNNNPNDFISTNTNTSLQNSIHAPPISMDTSAANNNASSTNTNSNEDSTITGSSIEDKHNSLMEIESSNNNNNSFETVTNRCSTRITKTSNTHPISPYTTNRPSK